AAGVAIDVDVGQEAHLHAQPALTGAALAPSAGDVEGEASGAPAAQPGVGELREEAADAVVEADVRGGGRAGRAPDRRLVNLDGTLEMLDALDGAMRADATGGEPECPAGSAVEDVTHERGLAGAGDPGDTGPGAERDANVEVAQVVLARPAHN